MHPPPGRRLVQVFVAPSIPEGLLVRGLLEAEGIPVVVKGESEGPYRIGPVFLHVPEDLEVQARMVLAEALEDGRAGRATNGDEPAGGTGREGPGAD